MCVTLTWQYGERIQEAGVGGGFLERFLGQWWGGEWGCVVSWAKWRPTFVVSPLGVTFEKFGVYALDGARL